MEAREEAERLCQLFEGEQAQTAAKAALVPPSYQLISFLSGQLSVVKNQAQMLMGLSGLIVTVTGFSGHHMVRGGPPSTVAMIVGILFIMGGVTITLRTLGKLRWVTQDLQDDITKMTEIVIRRRNAEQAALTLAGLLVGLGLASYLVAVVLAALHNGLML